MIIVLMGMELLVFICSFFLQELIDVEGDGMADMVFRCIQEMDIDNRMMVLRSISEKILCPVSFSDWALNFWILLYEWLLASVEV